MNCSLSQYVRSRKNVHNLISRHDISLVLSSSSGLIFLAKDINSLNELLKFSTCINTIDVISLMSMEFDVRIISKDQRCVALFWGVFPPLQSTPFPASLLLLHKNSPDVFLLPHCLHSWSVYFEFTHKFISRSNVFAARVASDLYDEDPRKKSSFFRLALAASGLVVGVAFLSNTRVFCVCLCVIHFAIEPRMCVSLRCDLKSDVWMISEGKKKLDVSLCLCDVVCRVYGLCVLRVM